MGAENFFKCYRFSFIFCGAVTTNEIMGFSYVLIALSQNQYVIILFLKDELILESQMFQGDPSTALIVRVGIDFLVLIHPLKKVL